MIKTKAKKNIFRFGAVCILTATLLSLLCGCAFGAPLEPYGDGGYSQNEPSGMGGVHTESRDPIVGSWGFSHAYDISSKTTVQHSSSYFVKMTFYSDGTAVLIRDSGSSYLGTSEIKGDWQLKEEIDAGRVYNVNWYTDNTSPSFELLYFISDDDNSGYICAWNVQMPAYESVYLYYYKD